MKEKPVTSDKLLRIGDPRHVDEILEVLFQEGPAKSIRIPAQESLQASLAKAKENAILYGSLTHPTINNLFVAIRSNKIVALDFGITEDEFITRTESQLDAPVYFGPAETSSALAQVQAYLDGQRMVFELPTDISILTDFQQQVLQATLQIPRGRIATYLDIARKIGNPKAVRAVGQALGRNPIPIVIPCHRVIASNGSLGGYSGGGGLETKVKLLQLEGAMVV